MGDRINVVFVGNGGPSPAVYLHWNGTEAASWVKEFAPTMADRLGDASYAAARFVAFCAERIEGNSSLGILNVKDGLRDLLRPGAKPSIEQLGNLNHGDHGVLLVDTTVTGFALHKVEP